MDALLDYLLSNIFFRAFIAFCTIIGGLVGLLKFFFKIDNLQEFINVISPYLKQFKNILRKNNLIAFKIVFKIFLVAMGIVTISIASYIGISKISNYLANRNTITIGVMMPSDNQFFPLLNNVKSAIMLGVGNANNSRGVLDKRVMAMDISFIAERNIGEVLGTAFYFIDKYNIPAVINVGTSLSALALIPYFADKNVVQIVAIASSPKIRDTNGFTYRLHPDSNLEFKALGKYAATKANNIFAFTLSGSNSLQGFDSFSTEFTQAGGFLSYNTTFSYDDMYPYDSLESMIKSDPSCDILVIGSQTPFARILISSLESIGFSGNIFIDSWAIEEKSFLKDYSLNFIYADVNPFNVQQPTLLQKKFIKEYKEKFKKLPTKLEAYGYDAAGYLIHSIRNAENHSSEGIRQAIVNSGFYKGVMGDIKFDMYGIISEYPVNIMKLEDGRISALGNMSVKSREE
jgi:ABC-type branched-subunit amino acid transport system substrate-binding protein